MIEQALLLDNPFPGLRPFDTDESDRFFGRDGQSDEVLAKLRRARFVAVVGTSGSGKSSLVRAGVLPALYSGHLTSAGSHWRVAIFRPGDDPIGNLAEALSKPDVLGGRFADEGAAQREIKATLRSSSLGLVQAIADARLEAHENLLLVADQFEELFRFRQKIKAGRPEDEDAAFVKLLLEARLAGHAGDLPVYLVLTMRSDYLGEAAQFRGLPEAINEGQYLIPRMTDDEWREAITGPVWMHGAEITPQLVNRLLNDAGDRTLLKSAGEHADRLPILQHALMRTWEYWRNHRRGDEPISIPHYLRVGGMAGALSQHADEAFFELPQRRQVVAEQLFRRLTEKGSDGREGRRPATIQEICDASEASPEDVRAVIENFRRLGRSFLMPPLPAPLAPDTLIDISHESLIWGWERLRDWVNQEASCARIVERLSETAALHAEGKEGFLRNPALQTALDWRASVQPNAVWAARYGPNYHQAITFLEASQADFEREQTEKEAQRQRELAQAQEIAEKARLLADERQRRVKLQRIGLIIMTVLLLGLAWLTIYAFQQKAEAQKQSGIAEVQKAEAEKQRDATKIALKETEAARTETAEQRDSAKQAEAEAAAQRDSAKRAQAEAERQRNAAQLALKTVEAAKAETARQRDLAVAAEQKALGQQQEAIKQKEEAIKALALVTEIDRSAPFFKASWRDHQNPIIAAAFSPNGENVIAADGHGRVKTLEIKDAPAPAGFASTPYPQTALAFNHKGTQYLISQNSGRFFAGLRIQNVTGPPGEEFFPNGLGYTSSINYLGFSPDDSLAAVTVHNSLWVWDAKTKERKFEIPHKGGVNHVAFSSDSKLLVTASDDGTAQIWSAETNQQVALLPAGLARMNRAVFSHNGKFIVTASADGIAHLWDAKTGVSLLTLTGHKAGINSALFSPDDRFIATASDDRTARIWETDEALRRKQQGNEPVAQAKDPDDQAVLEQTTKEITKLLKEAKDSSTGLDRKRLMEVVESFLRSGLNQVDEVKSTVLAGHEAEVNNAIFSPDGRWVITASQDRTARVWQAVKDEKREAGESLAVLRGHIGPITSLDFSGQSKYVVTGSADRTVRVWDVSKLSGFTVSATVKADPPKFEGDCPVTIKLSASVTVAGSGGTVKYQFTTQTGELGQPQELIFDAPGTKEVSETWRINGSLSSASAALKILAPQPQEFKFADINIRCLNYEKVITSAAQLTVEVLRQIMPTLSQERLNLYLPHLQQAMSEFKINTPARQAAFLAQIAYESRELKFMEEIWGPTASQSNYEPPSDLATRYGNTQPGDGKRFKGRGALQLTGRAKYQEYGQLLGVDLVNNPELATIPELNFRITGAYWQKNNLNELADQQDFVAITKRINGGTNSLANREKYYNIAKQVLGVSDLYQQKQ